MLDRRQIERIAFWSSAALARTSEDACRQALEVALELTAKALGFDAREIGTLELFCKRAAGGDSATAASDGRIVEERR